MNNKQAEKAPKVGSKSFMTVGPTLHYSHENVLGCWLLALLAFGLVTLFWTKILTGEFWSFDPQSVISPGLWRLDKASIAGVSIFEYPWQIFVLGLLMGILAVAPALVSQLMSFSYSVPFILAVFFLADLPAFAGCLLVSCLAAACRPLRFRSRFVAIVLCMAPQLIYWGCLGSAKGVDPIKWGFSFAPWVCAWIMGLGIAGLVLGIGHFTRYRPGLVWLATALFLALAVITFETRIGFDELDYQLYVANNDPEDVPEFHDHSITEALDRTIRDPLARRFLAGFFYPSEPIPLRAELKKEIQAKLRLGRWPNWFIISPELKYQQKKDSLLKQYDTFIARRSNSRRMPIALYYTAMLSEYSPDLNVLQQEEKLHFYSDYPHGRSSNIWWSLYTDFGQSPESFEARWRIARIWAGQARFKQADDLAAQAEEMVAARLGELQENAEPGETLFSLFRAPPDSVTTKVNLEDLQRRLGRFRCLISAENRTGRPGPQKRLARFVMLNPHTTEYDRYLEELLDQTDANDPLRDNILLAQAQRIADDLRRAERFAELQEQFADADGGMQAMYELGRLKISLYQDEQDSQRKRQYLAEARGTLTSFISLYPDSYCAEQVRNILDELPEAD